MATTNVLKQQQLERYGVDGLNWMTASRLLDKYVRNKGVGGEGSRSTISAKLNAVGFYLFKSYVKEGRLDQILGSMKDSKLDAYEVLADYASYLQKELKTKPNEIGSKVRWARKFLRYCRVPIDLEAAKARSKVPFNFTNPYQI